MSILWFVDLEAAIRGVEIKQLDDTCKAELKNWFKEL